MRSAFRRVGRQPRPVVVGRGSYRNLGAGWASPDGEMPAVLGLSSLTDLTELDTVRSLRGRYAG